MLDKPDKLKLCIAGYNHAVLTAKTSPYYCERETAIEWLNSPQGRKMEFLARNLRNQE